METVQLKIEFENSLRRASVARADTLAKAKTTIRALIGVEEFDLKYRDEENDLITIGSDVELQDVLESSIKSGKILRLIVTPVDGSGIAQGQPIKEAEPVPPEVEPEPEVPWINLARALADPEKVGRIQQVIQSPVITDAINRAAQAYVDSKGDTLVTGVVASQQIPVIMAIIAELLEELPVLKDLQHLIMNWCAGNTATAPPFAAFASVFGRGFPADQASSSPFEHPHHHGPHHHPHQHPHHPHHHHHHHHHGPPHNPWGKDQKPKHIGVFCDGCNSDGSLKTASIAAGNQTRRGFISGVRFKSQSLNDFDLCQSCKASGRFPDATYGPFTEIAGLDVRNQKGPGCKGSWWHDHKEHRNWRTRGNDQAEPDKQAQDVPQATQQPDDFFEAIRTAIAKGTEAFKEAASSEGTEFSEIARAIAESLNYEGEPKKSSDKRADPKVHVATVSQKPAAVPEQDPFIKWAPQLQQLQVLGFENLETYIDILEEENGDLDQVVNRIVRRDS